MPLTATKSGHTGKRHIRRELINRRFIIFVRSFFSIRRRIVRYNEAEDGRSMPTYFLGGAEATAAVRERE